VAYVGRAPQVPNQPPIGLEVEVIGVYTLYAHTRLEAVPVSHCKIAPQKSLPSRQFTGKNPPLPAPARAGRIFDGYLIGRGEAFLRGDPIMGRLFMWPAIF